MAGSEDRTPSEARSEAKIAGDLRREMLNDEMGRDPSQGPRPLPEIKNLTQPLPVENTLHGLHGAAEALIERAKEMAAYPLTETVIDVDGNVVAVKPVNWTSSDIAKNYRAAADLYEKIAAIQDEIPPDPYVLPHWKASGPINVHSIQSAERPFAALQLRLKGMSYQEIADALGYADKSGAFRAVSKMLADTVQPAADDLRKLEGDRLDMMLETAWSVVLGAHGRVNLPALDRCIAIEKLRIKLLGLELPRRVDVHAVIERVAAQQGYDDDEKQQATEFVKSYLREKRQAQLAEI